MKNVIRNEPFHLEKKLVDSTYDTLIEAGGGRVFGSELDDDYEEELKEFAEEKGEKNKERFCKESRQATMGRLSEMGLVNWMIYSKKLEERLEVENPRPEKYGKSCFTLNKSLKSNW